jgi:hypothetical protein
MGRIATMIFQGGYGCPEGIANKELFLSFKNGLVPRFPVTILAIVIFLMIVLLGQIASAQEGFGKISAAGQTIPGVRRETAKSNQSQVVWHQGHWWGVFKKDISGGPWWVYKFNGTNWVEIVFIGISGGSEADAYVDGDNQKLYVLVSTSVKAVSRLSFDGGIWTLDVGFPVSVGVNAAGGDPACISGAADGDLFIFFVDGGNIQGLYSTDQGVSWTSAFSIAATNASSALTDAIPFSFGGQNYVGLFVAEGDGDTESSFHRLNDLADPTISINWVKETLPAEPQFDSDDHVNITRDTAHNLYIISKLGSKNNFYLFKRRNNGNWSFFNILPDFGTRPSVAIDETNNSLIIVGTVRNGLEASNTIQYTVLNKDNLYDVDNTVWTPVLENGTDIFNDATISYQIHDNTSNLMICASNTTTSQVWYNLLNVDDIALPVFLASFQANPGVDQINLEWVTHSEVDNWEWIVYRREEGEEQFRELTRLPGNGTTNSSTYYTLSDSDVLPGIVYYYRLANVDFNGQVNYYPESVKTSLTPISIFKLYANYPNPFNAETTVSFEIGERSYTRVYIYDMMGRLVKNLFEGYLPAGSYNYKWNGKDQYDKDVASGVYLLNVSAGQFRESGKMILSR